MLTAAIKKLIKPNDEQSWYNKANAAFESRNEWYRCHELLSYEKASADMRERTHPDVVEDFQKYYWDTRVLDFTMILKVVDHRYYYKYLRLPASLTSPSVSGMFLLYYDTELTLRQLVALGSDHATIS